MRLLTSQKKPVKYFSLKMKKMKLLIKRMSQISLINKYFNELGDNLSNDIPLSTSTPDRCFTNFQSPTDTLSHFKEVSGKIIYNYNCYINMNVLGFSFDARVIINFVIQLIQ